MTNSTPTDTYSEAETEARREAVLKKLLVTPHKPLKGGKVKPKTQRKKRDTP